MARGCLICGKLEGEDGKLTAQIRELPGSRSGSVEFECPRCGKYRPSASRTGSLADTVNALRASALSRARHDSAIAARDISGFLVVQDDFEETTLQNAPPMPKDLTRIDLALEYLAECANGGVTSKFAPPVFAAVTFMLLDEVPALIERLRHEDFLLPGDDSKGDVVVLTTAGWKRANEPREKKQMFAEIRDKVTQLTKD